MPWDAHTRESTALSSAAVVVVPERSRRRGSGNLPAAAPQSGTNHSSDLCCKAGSGTVKSDLCAGSGTVKSDLCGGRAEQSDDPGAKIHGEREKFDLHTDAYPSGDFGKSKIRPDAAGNRMLQTGGLGLTHRGGGLELIPQTGTCDQAGAALSLQTEFEFPGSAGFSAVSPPLATSTPRSPPHSPEPRPETPGGGGWELPRQHKRESGGKHPNISSVCCKGEAGTDTINPHTGTARGGILAEKPGVRPPGTDPETPQLLYNTRGTYTPRSPDYYTSRKHNYNRAGSLTCYINNKPYTTRKLSAGRRVVNMEQAKSRGDSVSDIAVQDALSLLLGKVNNTLSPKSLSHNITASASDDDALSQGDAAAEEESVQPDSPGRVSDSRGSGRGLVSDRGGNLATRAINGGLVDAVGPCSMGNCVDAGTVVTNPGDSFELKENNSSALDTQGRSDSITQPAANNEDKASKTSSDDGDTESGTGAEQENNDSGNVKHPEYTAVTEETDEEARIINGDINPDAENQVHVNDDAEKGVANGEGGVIDSVDVRIKTTPREHRKLCAQSDVRDKSCAKGEVYKRAELSAGGTGLYQPANTTLGGDTSAESEEQTLHSETLLSETPSSEPPQAEASQAESTHSSSDTKPGPGADRQQTEPQRDASQAEEKPTGEDRSAAAEEKPKVQEPIVSSILRKKSAIRRKPQTQLPDSAEVTEDKPRPEGTAAVSLRRKTPGNRGNRHQQLPSEEEQAKEEKPQVEDTTGSPLLRDRPSNRSGRLWNELEAVDAFTVETETRNKRRGLFIFETEDANTEDVYDVEEPDLYRVSVTSDLSDYNRSSVTSNLTDVSDCTRSSVNSNLTDDSDLFRASITSSLTDDSSLTDVSRLSVGDNTPDTLVTCPSEATPGKATSGEATSGGPSLYQPSEPCDTSVLSDTEGDTCLTQGEDTLADISELNSTEGNITDTSLTQSDIKPEDFPGTIKEGDIETDINSSQIDLPISPPAADMDTPVGFVVMDMGSADIVTMETLYKPEDMSLSDISHDDSADMLPSNTPGNHQVTPDNQVSEAGETREQEPGEGCCSTGMGRGENKTGAEKMKSCSSDADECDGIVSSAKDGDSAADVTTHTGIEHQDESNGTHTTKTEERMAQEDMPSSHHQFMVPELYIPSAVDLETSESDLDISATSDPHDGIASEKQTLYVPVAESSSDTDEDDTVEIRNPGPKNRRADLNKDERQDHNSRESSDREVAKLGEDLTSAEIKALKSLDEKLSGAINSGLSLTGGISGGLTISTAADQTGDPERKCEEEEGQGSSPAEVVEFQAFQPLLRNRSPRSSVSPRSPCVRVVSSFTFPVDERDTRDADNLNVNNSCSLNSQRAAYDSRDVSDIEEESADSLQSSGSSDTVTIEGSVVPLEQSEGTTTVSSHLVVTSGLKAGFCKSEEGFQKQGSVERHDSAGMGRMDNYTQGSSSTAPAPAPPPGTGKENGHTNGISKTENTASQEGINNDTSPVTANGSAVSGSVPSLTTPTSQGSQGSQGSGREVEGLKSEVSLLRKELSKCRDTISKLQEKEKQMRDRLCEQASRQLEKGTTKFEDLNLGDNRPTQLIRRFGNLYSEVRLDAFDALDDLPEIAEFDDLKGKLLFSVVVLGFRAAQKGLQDMKARVHSLLYIPASDSDITDPLAKEMDDTVAVYLRKTVDKYDMRPLIEDVCAQVYSTLYDYPCLKACEGLHTYIEESVRLAWALSVQNPPLVIDFDSKLFKDDMHTRFHSSDPESNQIASVLWPALLEGDNGQCVHKGVVIT